jgi:hypothetical protein
VSDVRKKRKVGSMIHDTKSIVVVFAITAVMLLMGLGLIAWGIEGMAAL